jgi:hypothetical protein
MTIGLKLPGSHTLVPFVVLLAFTGCGEQPSGAGPANAAAAEAPNEATTSAAMAPVSALPAATAALPTAAAPLGCPAAIGGGSSVPAGARVMGDLPSARTPLSFAAVVFGSPADVRDDRVLAEEEPDTTADETSDGASVTQVKATASAPYSLACGYAEAPGFADQGALVVLPLPAGSTLECRIKLDAPGATTAACAPAA